MQITEIKKQNFKSRLIEIYLDGEYAFSLYDNQAKQLKLEAGEFLSSSDIEKIDDVVKKNALQTALNIVLRTDSTVYLISEKLRMKKYSDKVINYVVDYMEKHGYVNDFDYGRAFAGSAFGKGKGKKYVEFELLRRGLEKETVEIICDEFFIENKIKEVANKKFLSIIKNKENIGYKEWASLRDYLLRNGYEYMEISEVIEEMKGNYED